MKRIRSTCRGLLVFAVLACGEAHGAAAGGMFLRGPDPVKGYPAFHVGATGLRVAIGKGLIVTVEGAEPNTPAAGKFSKGEVIVTVNGTSLDVPDARVVLGEALGRAEAADGRMVFGVRGPDGVVKRVTVGIPVLGAYSKTWPLNCRKSAAIIRRDAEFILKDDKLKKPGVLGALAGLFLLSTGDDRYLPAVKALVEKLPPDDAGSHTWNNGYNGIAIGEYYLRTGDATALPRLKAICDDAARRQYFGGWNHWGDCATGYVQGGLMNPAGIQVLTTLLLAEECGVDVDRGTLIRALTFFYRFVGHGAVPYGDHRDEGWLSSNGKNGMLCAALSLLDGRTYRQASQLLALDMADSYRWLLSGHTGGGFDVIWRGIAAPHVPDDKQGHYRRCMDKLAWYYDLSRLPEGGFSMCGGERYAGPEWGSAGMGLAYTAPLKTLRITGAPHSRFSKPVNLPDRPWGRPADLEFLSTENCTGYGREALEPHELYDRLGDAYDTPKEGLKPDTAFYVRMLRNYNAVARTQAAHALGRLGAADELVTALTDKDPRVRRAGLDAISEYRYWWGGGKGTLSPDVVSAKCLPYIVKILRDPDSAMFEIDGALNALGFARPEDVVKNIDVVREHLDDDEWWLREASWRALRPVLADEARLAPVLPKLLECFAKEEHVMPRRVFMDELKKVLTDKAMSDAIKERVTAGMLEAMRGTPVAPGYKEPIGVTAIYETCRYLNLGKNPVASVEAMRGVERVLPALPAMLAVWLFNGDRWGNPGLLKCAENLGDNAAPLIEGFKRMLPVMQAKAKGKDAKTVEPVIAGIKAAIESYGKP